MTFYASDVSLLTASVSYKRDVCLPACTHFPAASPETTHRVSFRAEEGSDAKRSGPFAACEREIGLYACVDSAAWVQRLLDLGVRDIQLRIKNRPAGELDREVGEAAESCRKAQARLWVNDYWKLALRHQTYGLHIGQEDLEGLLTAPDQPLTAIQRGGVRLGISTHTFAELGRAVALRPSYISLGPIFPTASKKVNFGPQGLARLKQWRHLVDVPLVAIGGIGLEAVPAVQKAGADGICVISALTKASDLAEAVKKWQEVCGTSN
jgi:thiamine-phosphate diphosphorylase